MNVAGALPDGGGGGGTGMEGRGASGGTEAFQALQEIADPEQDSARDAEEKGGLYRRALDLIRGVTTNSAFPPNAKRAEK